jgi:hypothetical protein
MLVPDHIHVISYFPTTCHIYNVIWIQLEGVLGDSRSFSSIFFNISNVRFFKNKFKTTTSLLCLIQLCHSQICGSFPGSLPDLRVTLKVAGARSQSNLPWHAFSLFEHFPPSTEWTWSQNFMTTKIMVFLNVMPCSLLGRWLCLEEQWYLSTRLYETSPQNTVMFRDTAARTSRPTLYTILNTRQKNGRDHVI